jgi:2,4-dienoyl-CoA reductase (NADPH2)
VVVATGVTPRDPQIPGQDHPMVLSYIDVLRHHKPVGQRVAVIGAGGIGFDVAEYLVAAPMSTGHTATTDLPAWQAEWGVTDPALAPAAWQRHRPAGQRRRRTAGDAAAAQGRQARRRPGQNHRLDPPRRAEDEAGAHDGGVNYERIGDEGC